MAARNAKHLTLHRQWFPTVGNEVEVTVAADFGANGPVTLSLWHSNVDGEREEMFSRDADTPRELQEYLDEAAALDFQLTYDWSELRKAGKSLPRRFQTIFTYHDLIGSYPLRVREDYWEACHDWATFEGDISLDVSSKWTGEIREYTWAWACTVTVKSGDSDTAVASGESYQEFLDDLETSIYQATVGQSTVDDAISRHKVLGRYLRELKKAAGES